MLLNKFFFFFLISFAMGQEGDPEMQPPPYEDPFVKYAKRLVSGEWHKVYSYKKENFYWQDESGLRGVILEPKLFVWFVMEDTENKDAHHAFFEKMAKQLGDVKSIARYNFSLNAYILEYENGESALTAIEKLGTAQLQEYKEPIAVFAPIIRHKGRTSVITVDIIHLKVKSPVSVSLMMERMKKFGDFNVAQITPTRDKKPQEFLVTIEKLKSPTNIFILANLIAEDKWFEWARPSFSALQPDIIPRLSVSPIGLNTLGEQRFATLEVDIFSDKITLRKDLISQLDQNWFMNAKAMFLEVGKPVIKEANLEDGVMRITITWPFKYFEPGNYGLRGIQIPYTELVNGKLENKTIWPEGAGFTVASVIEGSNPPITDVQPLATPEILQNLPEPTISSMTSLESDFVEKIYANGYWLGIAAATIGAGMIIWPLGMVILAVTSGWKIQREAKKADADMWEQLRIVADLLKIENADWLEQYKAVESSLKPILSRFFGYSQMISPEEVVGNGTLVSILTGLERIYSNDQPSEQQKKMLRQELIVFYNHNKERRALNV